MKNDIQVYGLPRSGTNLLEWSIVNYFEDVVYENKYKVCDVEGLNIYGKKVAAKHSYPSFEFSNKVIIIYKEYDKWSQSYEKWAYKKSNIESWKTYMSKSKEMNQEKCLLISHDDITKKYEETLKLISTKFDLKLTTDIISRPKNYMNMSGANASPIKNKIYKHE